ncbi:hypothetical protein EBT25_10200 [bacterium]|nr:hypothetical protein [bacterium]
MANSNLKPFKVQPYIVWAFVIALLALVIFASTRSNYEVGPPMTPLIPSPADTLPSQIPAAEPTPVVETPPNLFPPPADTMKEYEHSNLTLEPLMRSVWNSGVGMMSLEDADGSMYPATLDDIFKASEQDGFMKASVDTIYDVMSQTPPRLMTDEV